MLINRIFSYRLIYCSGGFIQLLSEEEMMTHWKPSYLVIIAIYTLTLIGVMSLALSGIIEVPGEQGVSLLIACLALLISLIQMAESNKKRIPVNCKVWLWGNKRGQSFKVTLKFENQMDVPLDEFKFRLKLPHGVFAPMKTGSSGVEKHSYGKTDVISCDGIDFLGVPKSGTEFESISFAFNWDKFPKQKRSCLISLSASGLAPIRLKLSHEQLVSLSKGEHRSEETALRFE